MKVVREKKDARYLLKMLFEDLSKDSIVFLKRSPEPIGESRYRDVLKKLYLETGSCLATVWIFFEDGLTKIYSFYINTDLEEGEFDNILTLKGTVEGKLIEEKDSLKKITIFEKATFENGEEILKYLDDVGNKYREREIKATLRSALKGEIE